MADKGWVLVINDAPRFRDHVVCWLEKAQYRYTFVESPEEAAALLAHDSFDAVIFSSELVFPHTFRLLASEGRRRRPGRTLHQQLVRRERRGQQSGRPSASSPPAPPAPP